MPNLDEMWLISYYVNQLGVIRSKGKSYLKDILRLYLLNGCCDNYSTLIKMAAKARGVSPNTVRGCIIRFLSWSWEEGFSDAWEYYTGWRSTVPPWPTLAVRLVCESYPSFCAVFQKKMEQEQKIPAAYYLNWRCGGDNPGQKEK